MRLLLDELYSKRIAEELRARDPAAARRGGDDGARSIAAFSSRRWAASRSRQTVRLYVRVLGDFLSRRPDDDALVGSYRWLPDVSEPRRP